MCFNADGLINFFFTKSSIEIFARVARVFLVSKILYLFFSRQFDFLICVYFFLNMHWAMSSEVI